MQICPRCSAENKDEVAACWNCAAPLENTEAGEAGMGEEVMIRRGIPWKPVVIILLIALLGFVAYRFAGVGAPGPVRVAQAYLDAKYNGRASLAAKVTTSDSATAPLLPNLLLVGKYEVGADPQFTGDHAEVPAQVSFRVDVGDLKDARLAAPAVAAQAELKQFLPTRIVLVKQAGQWKVDQTATSTQIKQDAARRFRDDKAWIGALFNNQPLSASPLFVQAPKPAAAPPPTTAASGPPTTAGPAPAAAPTPPPAVTPPGSQDFPSLMRERE